MEVKVIPLIRSSILLAFLLFGSTCLAEDRSCNFFDNEPGWRCSTGDCIPLNWVCDSIQQCPHPDVSDETIGCNLFNETGCNSWHGRRYVKCPFSPHRCVEDIEKECPREGEQDDPTLDLTSSTCPTNPLTKTEQWRCSDGLCIEMLNVCDGMRNCHDGSDETEGCNLFPDTKCRSWFGKRHITCTVNETTVCTLPEFEFVSVCRGCEDVSKWRCDNGWCIPEDKLFNGIPDCPDASDEHNLKVKWWLILLITMVVAINGIIVSFVYRYISKKTHYFSCKQCKKPSLRSPASTIQPRMDSPTSYDKPIETTECVDSCTLEDGSIEDWDYTDEAILPLKLIRLLENGDFWRKRSFVGTQENEAQLLYARIHQDTVLYRNLYHYIVYRYSTSENLARIIGLLHRWEMEFHNQVAIEVLKCWRLQLGMCDVLKHVIRSSQPPGVFDRFYEKFIFDIRNWFRRQRKKLPDKYRQTTERLYTALKIFRYSFRPFLGASALYFDIFKDIAIAVMIATSLSDLTKDNYIGNMKVCFETALLFIFVIAIVLVQIGFMVISAYYATDIFETCNHTKAHHRFFFRVMLFLLGPLMPAFILANHVYYSEQEHSLRRDLETCDFLGKESDIRSTCKTTLFRKIQQAQYRSQLHRRIYSFYRVTEAAIESISLIVVLVLIQIVTPRPHREIHLLNGVQSKIGDFLSLSTTDYVDRDTSTRDETFLNQLGIAKDVVFGVSISYSFVMIVTAFVRYVYQCKGKNVTFVGQIFLGLYVACHAVTRLTVTIAMFSTAEDSGATAPDSVYVDPEFSQHKGPVISILPASVLALMLFVIHFFVIYWYKQTRIEEFANADMVEKVVHVLVNTFVVVPFMPWDVASEKTLLDETGGIIDLPKTDQCVCLKRSASFDEIAKKLKAENKAFHKSHRRSTSDTTGMTMIMNETVCTVNSRSGSRNRLDGKESTVPSRSGSQNKINLTGKISDPSVVGNDQHDKGKKNAIVGGKMFNLVRKLEKQRKQAAKKDESTNTQNFFPNLVEAFDFSNVREKILNLWWEDPGKDLSLEKVLEKFGNLTTKDRIRNVYADLVKKGFINRKLFNPRRTKAEYFWLFILHLVINVIAFGIEITNGGIQTSKGLYYSWDIRLSTFFLGLVFLALYYKKYHLLHDLTHFQVCGYCWLYLPVFCCIKKDKAMTAIPGELDSFLKESNVIKTSKHDTNSSLAPPKSIETQTSLIEVYVKTDEGFEELASGTKILNEKDKPSFKMSLKESFQLSFRRKKSDEKSEGTQTEEKSKGSETDVAESTKPLLKNDDKNSVDKDSKNVVVSVL